MKMYGITQDPDTLNYMILLQEMIQGSLRSNLMKKKNIIQMTNFIIYIV
jgi:hypothetical protein